MKVLMPVLHYYPVIGGLETWTQNIAERLSSKSETFVVTGKILKEPSFEIKNGVKIFRTSLFTLKNLSYSSPIYIFTALPFIFFKSLFLIKQTSNIEHLTSNFLLHCQGFLSGFLGYLIFKLKKISYIVTVQRIEENRGFLRKLVYKNAKICIAASSAIKKYFEEIGCKNIEVIPNGIDLNKFEIRNSKLEIRERLGLKDEFVIMTVARLEKVKGIEYLIESMSNVKSQIPNAICLIVGDGSEKKNLELLTLNLKLQDRVKFLGQIPNEKIPEHLAVADCFVLPSLKEGFGISILEAMACKVPVIGTNIGGIPDIIKSGENGVLIEPKNPEAIAKAIYKIYSQPKFARNLVQNAKSNLEKYDWKRISEKVNQIYLKLAALT